MPSEKYSPFLLVLRLYVRPLSVLCQTTWASGTGFPSASFTTPFTVPNAPLWANAVAATNTDRIASSITKTNFRFMKASWAGPHEITHIAANLRLSELLEHTEADQQHPPREIPSAAARNY